MATLSSFIAKVKRDGLLTGSRYEVRIPGFNGQSGADLSLLCNAVQLPGSTIESSDISIFGEKRDTPTGRITYDTVSLSFYVDKNMTVREEFLKWQQQAFNTKSRRAAYYKEYIRDVEILVLDKRENNGSGAKKVILRECWPKVVGSLDLAAGSTDILVLRVTFSYKWSESFGFDSQSTVADHPPTKTATFANATAMQQSSVGSSRDRTSTADLTSFSNSSDPIASFLNSLGESQDIGNQVNNSASIFSQANPGSISQDFSSFGSSLTQALSSFGASISNARVTASTSPGDWSQAQIEANSDWVHARFSDGLDQIIHSGSSAKNMLIGAQVTIGDFTTTVNGHPGKSSDLVIGVQGSIDSAVFAKTRIDAYSTYASRENDKVGYRLAIQDGLDRAMYSLGPMSDVIKSVPNMTGIAGAKESMQGNKVNITCDRPMNSLSVNTSTISGLISKEF